MKKFLTGNEAIARGIYEAGVDIVYVYPSVMKKNVFAGIKELKDKIEIQACINEDVSLKQAIEISKSGKKVLTFLDKMNPDLLSIGTIVEGGLVVILNDDTGLTSIDNINDNREAAASSKLIVMEPGSSRDTKSMIKKAFVISCMYKMPVLIRVTARVGCSSGIVLCEEPKEEILNQLDLSINDKVDVCNTISEQDDFNKIQINSEKVGFICSGICTFYTKEVLGETVSYLDLKVVYPLPEEKIIEFSTNVDKLYIVEENNPYIETRVRSLGIECIGNELFESEGEINSGVIRKAIFGKGLDHVKSENDLVLSEEPFIDLEYILSLYDID